MDWTVATPGICAYVCVVASPILVLVYLWPQELHIGLFLFLPECTFLCETTTNFPRFNCTTGPYALF